MMTIKDFMKAEGHTIVTLSHALSEEIKAHNREDGPMYQNRLNSLMSGRLKAREHELRALLSLSGNMVDSYRG